MDDIYYYKEMISFLQMAMIFFHLYHYFQIEVAELKIALPISLEYAIYTDFFTKMTFKYLNQWTKPF